MNDNLLNVVKEIIEKNGESVLSEPKRVSSFLSDLAREVQKPQKTALIKSLEHEFAKILKDVPEPERNICKQKLAQKLNEEEGLELKLCEETLELLASVLFGEKQKNKDTHCKNCGKELQKEWEVCPYCGTQVYNKSNIIKGTNQQKINTASLSSKVNNTRQPSTVVTSSIRKGNVSLGWIVIMMLILGIVIFIIIQNNANDIRNLRGANVIIAQWSNAYNVNTYEPRNDSEEKELWWRKKVLADNGLWMEEVELSGWDDYFPLVVSNIMSGNKNYSLYCLPADWAMTLYRQGMLYPLSYSSVKLDNRVPIAGEKGAWNKMMEDLFTINGKQYAITPGIGGFGWQGNFVFFNKRLFRQAGLDPDLPFTLQRDGKWTWDAFFDICKQLTRDTNNDGIIDIYALPADDAREVMYGFVYGNNGNFVTIDNNGKFHNATNTPEFIEAIAFYQRLIKEGVMKNRPKNAEWGWNFDEFFNGKVAMVFDPEWRQGQLPEMADDYGMVLAPKGPRAANYRTSLTEMVYVVPSFFTKDEVDVILKAFDLWMTPMDTDWKPGYYPFHRDRRSVDETMAMQKDSNIATYRDFAIIPGYPSDAMLYDERFWENGTPSQIVESWAPRIQAILDEANR